MTKFVLARATDEEKQRPSDVFGSRLAELRRERGLSLEALAQRMRDEGFKTMSKTAVLHVETGKRGLSLDEALGFATVLAAVPAQMVSPPDDELVWLTENRAADGDGMRAWLRFGYSFLTDAGDERVEKLRLEVVEAHARALLDAGKLKDKAGQREALRAMIDIFTATDS